MNARYQHVWEESNYITIIMDDYNWIRVANFLKSEDCTTAALEI